MVKIIFKDKTEREFMHIDKTENESIVKCDSEIFSTNEIYKIYKVLKDLTFEECIMFHVGYDYKFKKPFYYNRYIKLDGDFDVTEFYKEVPFMEV